MAVKLLDAGVDDLYRRCHVIGSRQHVVHRDLCALQLALEHKGQLYLHARGYESRGGQVPRRKQHVVQQQAKVRLVDLAGQLHGA